MPSRVLSLVPFACVTTLVVTPLAAQTIARDPTSSEIIALSNLSKADDCASASSRGRVVERHTEPGRALAGVTFKDVKYGDSYINMPDLDGVKDPAKRKAIEAALDAMLVVGRELKLTVKGCGAAGRIEKLDAVAPAGPAKAAAKTKTRWSATKLSAAQHDLSITTADRKFGLSISCTRSSKGSLYFHTFFVMPRSWTIAGDRDVVSIDGAPTALEVDGADEGLTLSDTTVDNTVSLSDDVRKRLAGGSSLVVQGHGKGRKPQNATFDISNGQDAFAAFERDCGNLPPA